MKDYDSEGYGDEEDVEGMKKQLLENISILIERLVAGKRIDDPRGDQAVVREPRRMDGSPTRFV